MDYTELAAQLLQTMRLLHKTGPQKKIAGSMQGETFVLRYLFRRGSDVAPGEISSTMDISSARIAAALNSMEQKGLVTREIDKNDRRKILVKLTPAGCALAQRHQRDVIENAATMLRLLGDEDAREYIRITAKLADICKNKMSGKK
ncbi:MAG: winged helix DNA-binding protein [Christensenellaceae bacterium]|jgi:DNA-binding MarR family transcriptional regulator|nr:winged helix DNA-binding protein [Christensenellaceae bacterium]